MCMPALAQFDTTVGRGAVNTLRRFHVAHYGQLDGSGITAGGNAIGTRVNRGGVQAIHFQGTATKTTIATWGIQSVDSGGRDFATIGGT